MTSLSPPSSSVCYAVDRTYIWQPAFIAAVYETNDEVMMARILDARAAIEQGSWFPLKKTVWNIGNF